MLYFQVTFSLPLTSSLLSRTNLQDIKSWPIVSISGLYEDAIEENRGKIVRERFSSNHNAAF